MLRWRRKRAERELEDELQFHLEQAAGKYGSRGRAEAVLGGSEATKEACRDERAGAWLASVGRDLRLGTRILRKNPGFTLAAAVTLALCIGAVVTAFGLLDYVSLRPPPFPRPDRILVISRVIGGRLAPNWPLWADDYADIRTGTSAFQALAAYDYRSENLASAGAGAVHADSLAVTADFFSLLGVAAAQGRTFLPGEDQAGHDHVVVLSDALWRKQFAAAPMLGRTVRLDGEPYTVIGIMPRGFARGDSGLDGAALWVPLTISPAEAQHGGAETMAVHVRGRLRPGATLAEAQSQIAAIARHEAATYRDKKGLEETAITLRKYLSLQEFTAAGLALMVMLPCLILLIGCANVAGLGLGRALSRSDEMAIRRALGAGRARLVRQVLTESALLAALAGALGLLLGWAGMAWLNAALAGVTARMDGRVLALTVAAAAVTALCAGLPPALRAGVRARPRGIIAGRSHGRDILVAIEIALTVASLIVIGFVAQSTHEEWTAPLGFNPAQVLAADISLTGPAYSAHQAQASFIERMRTASAALPGVKAAALVRPPPVMRFETAVAVRGQPPIDWRGKPMPEVFGITSGYLDTLRIPLLAGRGFTLADAAASEPVALISRDLARRLFPSGDSPLGRFIRFGPSGEPWRKIVGETGAIVNYMGDKSRSGEVFEPLAQAPRTSLGLVVRTATGVPPDSLTPALRRTLAHLDSTQALYGAQPLLAKLERAGAVNVDLSFAHAMELLGALALLLSAIGLYSIVAYAAEARRREIGIRMAVGATAPQVERLLLGRGMRLALIGLAVGCGLGWMGLRMLGTSLGSSPDAALYAVPVVLLGAVAALASWLPARRAARADPLAALRID